MNCLRIFLWLTLLSLPARAWAQSAPVIVSGPDDRSVGSGSNATFQVTVTGMEPIQYRWFFNETNLLSATGPALTITNVSMRHGGLYSVIATNESGAVTSRLASLSVDDDLVFRVLALRTNGFIVVEHGPVSGDDRGGIAVSSSHVLYSGDSGPGRWDIDTLGNGTQLSRFADSFVTDLRTETVYSLADGNFELSFGGTITSLLELTPTGELTGNRIDLSQSIPATGDFGQVGVFSGRGRIVIHNRINAYSIAIPSGQVTDLGPSTLPFGPFSEGWAFWGVAEYFNNAVHLVYVDSRTFPRRNIIRNSLPSGTITTVARFTNMADMAVFALSPSLSRWFFHYEGTGQLRAGDETLGSAKALFTTDPGFPAILRDPASRTNFPGSTVTFSAVARGTPPLNYQWYYNGTPIDGANGETLTLNNLTVQSAGEYTVQVSNDSGLVLSGPAVLSIFTVPLIRFGPFNRTVYPGQGATFSLFVDGAPPLSYQWNYNGTPIPNGTNAVLFLSNVQPNQAGLYSVRITNIYGAAISTNATLTVITNPFITVQPAAQADFVGSNVAFTVTADGAPPLFYQWQHNGSPLPDATNRMLVLTNIQLSSAGNYSIVISNQYGTVLSSNAELTVFGNVAELGSFQIVSLLTSGAKVVDHDELTGDDRGGIAVSPTHVFINGDNRTARFLAGDLTGGTRVGNPRIDSMVTDLRTETVYLLGNGTNVVSSGTMTTLIEMDANGAPTSRRITLSRPVPLNNGFQPGIFAGYGRIVIYNGDRVFNILLPSGVVQDLGPIASFGHNFTETWAFWGVAEHVGNVIHLVYVEDFTRIVRRRVPDGQTTVIATFNSLSDMASIVVSPSRKRWYFHYEGGAQFGGNFETLGYADATFSIRSGTGLDHFEWGPINELQTINNSFPLTLTALNASNQVVTNFSGTINLSGLNVAGETPVTISPTLISNFVSGVWTGQVTVAQATPAMFLRADDGVGVRSDSPSFSVNLANDLVVVANDAPDPVTVGETLIYTILVTNTGPAAATAVTLTNTLATNLVVRSVTATAGSCVNEGRIVRCTFGAIAGAAGVSVMIETTPSSGGLTLSQLAVTRGEADANTVNNTITVSTLVRQPSISIDDVVFTEGDSGTNNLTFTLSLVPPSTNTVRVNFGTANGSAVGTGSAADFVARSGTITFPPGSTNQLLNIGVRSDRFFENDETFFINLTIPVNATIEDSQGLATLVNDDAMPSVSVTDVTVTELNTTATNAIFRVSLSGQSGLPVGITYAVSDGTAEAGIDFSNRVGQINFAAGTAVLTQSVSIPVYGDLIPEIEEVFYLNLLSVTNGTIVKAQGVGTIRNDDGIGELHHFGWTFIPSPQQPGTPFPVTLSALDIGGSLVTNYSGTADLFAIVPGFQPSNAVLGSVTHAFTASGDWTLGYSFTPTNELRVTHIRHYFGSKVSIWRDDGTLLVAMPVVSTGGRWEITALTNEVVLQPGTTYRIAAYTGGGSYYWTGNGTLTFPHGTLDNGYEGPGDAFPASADGVRWWFVDMLYTAVGYVSAPIVTPGVSGTFSNGIWIGELSVTQEVAGIRLEAWRPGPITGVSNPFDITSATDANVGVALHGTNHVHTLSNLVLTVVVTNRGPVAATDILLTNSIPAEFNFVSAIATQGACSNADGGVVCQLGSLPPRTGAVITITLQAGPTGTATIFATVAAAQVDLNPRNNSAKLPLTIYRDSDSDGIWDDWELDNGANPNDPSDANLDSDGDGHTALQEFHAQTDPNDSASVKLLTSISFDSSEVRLGFRGALGRTFRVERSPDLSGTNWTMVLEFELTPPNERQIVDPLPQQPPSMFYRALLLNPPAPLR